MSCVLVVTENIHLGYCDPPVSRQHRRQKDRRTEILLVKRERGRVKLCEHTLAHVGVQIHSGRDEGGVDEAEGAAEGADVEAEDGVAEGVFYEGLGEVSWYAGADADFWGQAAGGIVGE